MNYSCPVCHQPPKKCPQFSTYNYTKFQCVDHTPNFFLYVSTENPNQIRSVYLHSPKLNFNNVLVEGDYYWRIYEVKNTANNLGHGEALLTFPEALDLLNRYNNLLAFS